MNAPSDFAPEFFIAGLRNQRSVENRAIELLDRQIGRPGNYSEVLAKSRQHQQESGQQALRIKELLSGLGASHSTVENTVRTCQLRARATK